MQKVFRVTVDISKKIPAPAFEVNTNDLKSVKLEITITNGQSLLDLTDVTPRINIRKPDNEVIFQDCEIVDAKAGKVQIVLENQAYLVPGTHTAEIACYKGNEITAITGTFSYKSVKGIMNDEAVESKSEFTAIDRKIEEARKLLEDIGENGVGVDEQARQEIQEVSEALAEIESKKANLSDLNISNTPDKVKYYAHRGASSIAPENTIPAIEQAGALGYYGVEIDIRPTKDGKFVLIHDPDINTMTNGAGLVKDITLAEIHNYNVNKGNNIAKYPGLKMATLEECLTVCKKYGMKCLIEVKEYYLTEHPAMLVDIIVKMGMESQVEVMYYWETWVIREIRRLNKKIKVGIISATFSQDNLDLAINLGNSVMSIEYYNLTKEVIEECHQNNIPVSTYTVNTLNVARNLINNGVDFITTDHLL